MKKIDLKSFLIGVLFIALIFVILGSSSIETEKSNIGKYQIVAASTQKSPKYIIIDTETGIVVKTGYISGN